MVVPGQGKGPGQCQGRRGDQVHAWPQVCRTLSYRVICSSPSYPPREEADVADRADRTGRAVRTGRVNREGPAGRGGIVLGLKHVPKTVARQRVLVQLFHSGYSKVEKLEGMPLFPTHTLVTDPPIRLTSKFHRFHNDPTRFCHPPPLLSHLCGSYQFFSVLSE